MFAQRKRVTSPNSATTTSIPDTAAFRIDLPRWLRGLFRRDRRIVTALAAGDQTKALAGRFGIAAGRVLQLRRKYQRLFIAHFGRGFTAATPA